MILNSVLKARWVKLFRIRPLNNLLRVFFFVLHDQELQSQFTLISTIAPRFLRFLLLLGFAGFLFSLIGMSLFPERSSKEGEAYFSTLGQSIWNFELLLTTNNMPRLLVTAFQQEQKSALFIVIWVILGNFYFLNLTTAIVYEGYLQQKRQFVSNVRANYAANLELAFSFLREATENDDAEMVICNREENHLTSLKRNERGHKISPSPEFTTSINFGAVQNLLEELQALHCSDVYSFRSTFFGTKIAIGGFAPDSLNKDGNSDNALLHILTQRSPTQKIDRIQFAAICQLIQIKYIRDRAEAEPGTQTHKGCIFFHRTLPELWDTMTCRRLLLFIKSNTFEVSCSLSMFLGVILMSCYFRI